MYLSQIKIWNFRRYGHEGEVDLQKPDLTVSLNNGLNVLIGANDSGKTAVIDAVKLVCKTHATEWIRVTSEDFYKSGSFHANRFRIECIFKNLRDEEAAHFAENLGMEKIAGKDCPYLRVILDASRDGDRVQPFEITAGIDDSGRHLHALSREYLKSTYLMPLRDAKSELVPKRNSRLSQVLEGHEAFKEKDKHYLIEITRCFNCLMQKYFAAAFKAPECRKDPCDILPRFGGEAAAGENIRKAVDASIASFLGDEAQSTNFSVVEPKLKAILEGLRLSLGDELSGLGMHNLLFIATELLNLNRENWTGLRLGLIEELEAHLEPQAQLRVIQYLISFISNAIAEKNVGGQAKKSQDVQFILTTHSPNIGSKIPLKNLLICNNRQVFNMGDDCTKLLPEDYAFLERFLDVTKANLFFAKGVILVEGWAEEILLPVLAEKIGVDLAGKGISIINVGSTAFLRYSKIFQRKDPAAGEMDIQVAVVTDLDVKPDGYLPPKDGKKVKTEKDYDLEDVIGKKKARYRAKNVEAFVSPHWTLEYCLALSDKMCPLLINALKGAAKECEVSIDETSLTSMSALTIYQDVILENKISKSVLSQHLACELKMNKSLTKKDLEADPNIQYLVEAIKHAAK